MYETFVMVKKLSIFIQKKLKQRKILFWRLLKTKTMKMISTIGLISPEKGTLRLIEREFIIYMVGKKYKNI